VHSTGAVDPATLPPAAGVTLTLPEAALLPALLLALTLQLYVVPLVSPVTLIGLAAALTVIDAALAVQVAA